MSIKQFEIRFKTGKTKTIVAKSHEIKDGHHVFVKEDDIVEKIPESEAEVHFLIGTVGSNPAETRRSRNEKRPI
jgi:hypothetical protein